MEIKEIEQEIINCIKANLKMSGEPVPSINRNTAPLNDIPGFDSLRTIEIMVDLETKTGCVLQIEDIFDRPNPQALQICTLAEIINMKLKETK